MKKIFSLDGETNGLWGKAYAIGAIVYENGTEVERFVARLPDEAITDSWSRENVLPKIGGMAVTHDTYEDLIAAFARFYMAHKSDADIIVHMGYIVESRIFLDMHTLGMIGDWDGPLPLFDLSGNLQAAGADPTSIDRYALEHGISVGEFEGGTHNPLYDAAITAAVYMALVK